jgi:hypothetical protein
MSNKTKTETTKQENKLDPRMDAALYGSLLPRAQELLGQPAINSRMRQGMDAQYNYLNSPLYSSIFNSMLGQGMNMMNQGVAGNPYTMARSNHVRKGVMPQMFQPNYAPQQGQQPQQTALQVPNLINQDGMTDEQRRQLAFLWGQDQNARTG